MWAFGILIKMQREIYRSNHESCLQDARSNPQLFLGLEKKGGSSKSGIMEEGSKEDRRDQRKKKQASEYIPWTRPACLVLLSIPVDMVIVYLCRQILIVFSCKQDRIVNSYTQCEDCIVYCGRQNCFVYFCRQDLIVNSDLWIYWYSFCLFRQTRTVLYIFVDKVVVYS